MPEGHVIVTLDTKGVATVTLNRPEKHNAFDDTMIKSLTKKLSTLSNDNDVRVVVLAARGASFCAGADLQWMKQTVGYSKDQNTNDAKLLAQLLHVLNNVPKPTLALIQGPAYAGGVGLICACDIAVAARSACFSITEVRLGLIPSVISPLVVNAIGESYARRYFLTGERISSAEAHRIGLVHEVVPSEALAARGETFVKLLLKGGPESLGEAKALIRAVRGREVDSALLGDHVQRIARVRVSDEAQDGMGAFLEKRKPRWV